jgi:hypothetical protein
MDRSRRYYWLVTALQGTSLFLENIKEYMPLGQEDSKLLGAGQIARYQRSMGSGEFSIWGL